MPNVADMMPTLPTHFSEEEQEFLQSVASDLIQQLEQCERALSDKFDAQLFDLEEGNACWSLLPSKVRTAIKRGKDGR